MASLADLYRWMCLRCVSAAAVLIVLSSLGCGGEDTWNVDVVSFEVSPAAEECGEECDDDPIFGPLYRGMMQHDRAVRCTALCDSIADPSSENSPFRVTLKCAAVELLGARLPRAVKGAPQELTDSF